MTTVVESGVEKPGGQVVWSLLAALVENTTDIISVWEADGTIRYMSPSVERILGFQPAELIGQDAFSYIHPDDLPAVQKIFAGAIQRPGHIDAGEFRHRHKDGSWRVLEATGKNLLADEAVKGVIVSSRDITARRQADEALQQHAAEMWWQPPADRDKIAPAPVPRMTQICAATAVGIALLTLAGWLVGARFLAGQWASIVPMAPSTALAFLLLGGALFGCARWPAARLSRCLALAAVSLVALLGLLVLVGLEGRLNVALGPFHSQNPALWHSLMALAACGLIVAATGWVARRTGAAIEQAQWLSRSLARFPDENPSPVLRVTRAGRLLYANRSSQRLLESWHCEKPGQSLPDTERRWIAEALARGVSQHHEVTCGAITYWLMLTPVPEMNYVNIYGRDITDRQQARRAAEERQARLTGIVNSAMDAIISVDADQRVVLCNPAAEKMFGYPAAELLGQPLDRLIPLHFLEEHRRQVADFGATGVTKRRMNELLAVTGRRANGGEFPVETSISQVKVGGQKIFTAILRDVTERERSRTQMELMARRLGSLSRQLMEVQERERGALARELHDEIGQSLTLLKINVKSVLADHPDLDGTLVQELELIDQLLQQIRELAVKLRPAILDELGLEPALRWLVDRTAKHAGFTVQFDAEVGPTRASREVETACFRVAQEALTNALRHAQARRVEIALRQDDQGALRLVLTDDGVGFDPRAARERMARGESFGLLSMEERARFVGGELHIESRPGAGTALRVVFPASQDRSASRDGS